MADKLRSVNTKFWDDTFISELTPSEKLLFLYLLTNPLTNLLGIYEITMKRICFDTGLKTDTIRKGLERFGRVKKVYFVNDFIILPNFLKNQRLNTNMKIGITKIFNQLPNELKNSILDNHSKGLPNDYQTIRNGMLKYEIEIEEEIEKEKGNRKGIENINLSFYSNEIKLNKEETLIDKYVAFVKYLFGENAIGCLVEHIVKLKKQLTFDEYRTIFKKAHLKNITISELMDSWVNNPGYSKGKVSIYLTLNSWINRSDGKKLSTYVEKSWDEVTKTDETINLLKIINKMSKHE